MKMISDWAWVVEFKDGTKACVRGVLNRDSRGLLVLKPLDRTGNRKASIYLPIDGFKIFYVANPEKMDWPEDELFFWMESEDDRHGRDGDSTRQPQRDLREGPQD